VSSSSSPEGAATGSVPLRAALKRVVMAGVPPVRRLIAERDALRQEVASLSVGGGTPSPTGGTHVKHLFIVTYGRSGSTLLQGILNSTPGVLIRGENRGITYKLHEFHKVATQTAAEKGDFARRPVNPFFGIRDYPRDVALQRMRALVEDTLLRPEPGTRLVGFKEIRWYHADLDDYVDFLCALFPDARFVVNTRNLADVAKSYWWGERDDPEAELADIERRILAVGERLGPRRAFRVHYDDFVADPTSLRALFEWVGIPWDEARVRGAMEFDYARRPPDGG
jgi:hypothetical protein